MVKLNLPEVEKNIVSTFSAVGHDMSEEARAVYMLYLCTNQVNSLIDEIYLQLHVQGRGAEEEVALFLSSAIGEVYPEFHPKFHSKPSDLIEECHSFLIEEWGQSTIEIGLERGWFVCEEGRVNLTPSYQ